MQLVLLVLLVLLALFALVAPGLEFSGVRCAEEPAARVDCYPTAARFPNATEELCLAHGCCWKPLDNGGVPCAFDAVQAPAVADCARVPLASRLPCRNPRFASEGFTLDSCHLAGCCFDDGEEDVAAACFQPFFEGYELVTLDETADGWRGYLVLRRFERGPFANDLPVLLLHVARASHRRVRVRISDPAFPRYETPNVVDAADEASPGDKDKDLFDVFFTRNPFGVAITRRDTGEVLFNSTPPLERDHTTNGLVFENQFIEFSTQLHSTWLSDSDGDGEGPVLYGLGDRLAPLRLRADRHGRRYPLFAVTGKSSNNQTPAHAGSVHPMYLQVAPSGLAHGVFVRSSNAMEAVVQRDAVTFRLTGGIVDVEIFAGPTPSDVIGEYTGVVGRPEIPPYWALGFHVGSRRDHSASAAVKTVTRLRVAGMPMDAYWLGGEYMNDKVPLTLDEVRFSAADMREFVDDMHFNGQYLVCMQVPTVVSEQDAGVPTMRLESGQSLDTFHRGEELDVFVKSVFGERYAEKFVAGHWSVFVDFFHPNVSTFWRGQLGDFHDELLPFDGLWLERNEPSSTCDRAFADESDVCPAEAEQPEGQGSARWFVLHDGQLSADEADPEPGVIPTAPPAAGGGFIRSADVSYPFDPFRQPFVPGETVVGNAPGTLRGNLNARTLPLALNHFNSMHYNVHSMYGLAQTRVTRGTLDELVQKRALLISRSTFPGSGQFSGHSLQDFDATWEHLPLAIASALRMNMFGIPLVGPNLGGLRGDITSELYVRWFQAASLLPLLRSHSREDAKFPTPIDFDESTTNVLRSTLLRRYRYLPYMYTLFYQAHAYGSPVVQPVGFAFPSDVFAHRADTQFMLGPALMVTPVVEKKAIAADVYFPNATWFDVEDGRLLFAPNSRQPQCARLLTPLSKLQLHIRGGHIVPTQQPQTTTALSRHENYVLLAALSDAGSNDNELASAAGEIYIDDGETLDPIKNERYSLVQFSVMQNASDTLEVVSKVSFGGYDGPEMRAELTSVKVYGVRGGFHGNSSIKATLVMSSDSSSQPVRVDYFSQSNTLVLSRLRIPISDEFAVQVRADNGAVGGEDRGKEEGENGEVSVESRRGSAASESQAGSTDGAEDEGEGEEQGTSSKVEESSESQEKHKGGIYSTAAMIGASVAVVLVIGVCIVYFVRRRGYNAIT
jgi:lysosomal alpha-glucosidase